MKKIKLLLFSASLSLILLACSSENHTEKSSINSEQNNGIETIVTHGNFIEYDNESELFGDAELIVVAKTNKNFMEREHVIEYASNNDDIEADLPQAVSDFHTKTPIDIIKVLKQPQSFSIPKDNKITIIEPVALLEDNGLKKLSVENYLEMEEGKHYILYLKKNTYGEYSVINMNNGRFNLEGSDKIVNLSEHGHENDKQKHEKMKQSVKNRFKEQINKTNAID